MSVRPLRWFRDENGWTTPEGRRGEFVALVVGLPLFAWFVSSDPGIAAPTDYPLAVLLGAVGGFGYAIYWRDRLLSRLPDGTASVVSTLLSGGLGLTALEIVHLAAPTVLFVLTAGGTVLAIYGVWLLSPMHRGLEPPRRGIEPPTELEGEGVGGSERAMASSEPATDGGSDR